MGFGHLAIWRDFDVANLTGFDDLKSTGYRHREFNGIWCLEIWRDLYALNWILRLVHSEDWIMTEWEHRMKGPFIGSRQTGRARWGIREGTSLILKQNDITKIVHFGILIHVLSWRQQKHKCLFWLLRLFDELFDVIIDVDSAIVSKNQLWKMEIYILCLAPIWTSCHLK